MYGHEFPFACVAVLTIPDIQETHTAGSLAIQAIRDAIGLYTYATTSPKLRKVPFHQHFIPVIVFRGVTLHFYKVPVNDKLRDAVKCGTSLAKPTFVEHLVLPGVTNYETEGLYPLKNRRIALAAFQATRDLVRRSVTRLTRL